jgi:hypothetical protein
MTWPKDHIPSALLALALLVSAGLLLALGTEMTFFQDSWAFLLERQGHSGDDFLRPHNEHISVIPVALQKLSLALFGMESDFPERLLLTSMLALTAVLFFVYVRRRVGPWPALAAAVVLLFLGPAWEVLLWPFEISLVGSTLCGLAMLLALERDDRQGDAAACGLLALAIGFSSLGIPFAAAAAVDVWQRRGRRGWARAYVFLLPLLLYAAWYFSYGRQAGNAVSWHSVLDAPRFVAEGVGASVASISGLRTIALGVNGAEHPYLGLLTVEVLVVVCGYLLWRRPGALRRLVADPPPGLLPPLAAAATFWGLAAVNDLPGRAPHASRYMHVGAIFVFLIAANILAGRPIGRRAGYAIAVVATLAIGSNLVALLDGRDRLVDESVVTRADLAAIEIAHRTVDPEFRLGPEFAGTVSLVNVSAAPYLAEVDEYGSPAYTPAELTEAPALGKWQADVVLAHALPLSTETFDGPPTGATKLCRALPGNSGSQEMRLAAGTTAIEVPPGPPAAAAMRRYASGTYPVRLGELGGGTTTLLRIPRDDAARPWRLRIEARRDVTVCRRPRA